MATPITEPLKQLIDVSDSFTGIFNTKDESDQYVKYLQESQYKVVVPNLDTLELSGKTKKAFIVVDGEPYFYENDKGFDIVIGGKVEKSKTIISTETKVVPVPSDKDVKEVVKKLIAEKYTVFSPTQPGPPPPPGTVSGETKKIIFDESCPFSPPFPKIPSPINPKPGDSSLWVVVAVKK